MRLWGLYLTVWRALRTATLNKVAGSDTKSLSESSSNVVLGYCSRYKSLSARPRYQSSPNPVWAPSLP